MAGPKNLPDAVGSMFEGLDQEAPDGSDNVPPHPWQDFGFDNENDDGGDEPFVVSSDDVEDW